MIPVFYGERMVADADSFSPSAGKPALVVAAWREAGLPIAWHDVAPVSESELTAVHDAAYVRDVLACRRENGFGNRRGEVARSLPYTSGALLCAARHALEHGIACAPVSGFHHAHYDHGGGFCTFNGLMVAAVCLLRDAAVRRVMILDADMHYGDGTDDIVARLGLACCVDNVTLGRWYSTPDEAGEYLAAIEHASRRFAEFDLVLYQAGADVHVRDPLGGVLTTAQMRCRDAQVFDAARAAGVPLAWNLAGGYQSPVSRIVELHTQTLRECARAYCTGAGGLGQ